MHTVCICILGGMNETVASYIEKNMYLFIKHTCYVCSDKDAHGGVVFFGDDDRGVYSTVGLRRGGEQGGGLEGVHGPLDALVALDVAPPPEVDDHVDGQHRDEVVEHEVGRGERHDIV